MLGMVLLVAVDASARPAGFHVPRTWKGGPGASLSMATAFAQTTEGYLWVGTPAGLYRFNGVDFLQLRPPAAGDGRVALHVTALCADRQGGLWIGTFADGLVYLRQGQFTRYRSGQGLENDRIKAVFEDRDGGIWVATDGGGAFRLAGHRFDPVRFENGAAPEHPTAFAQDADGRIWMGTHGKGVYRFRDRHLDDVVLPGRTVKAMARAPDGTLWIATSAGLTRATNGRLEPVSLSQPAGSPAHETFVTSVAVDAEGTLWAGTLTGLVRKGTEGWERFGRREGLGNGLVTAAFADREGSLWVGVEVGDLYQFKRSQFKLLEPFNSRLQAVNALCEDRAGRLWIGGSAGLVAFQDGQRIWAPAPGDLAAQEVSAVGEDPEGRIWFATRRGDWGWWRDGVVERFPMENVNLTRRWASFFFRTRAGEFWAGTHDGFLRIEPDGSLAGFESGHLPHLQTLSACEDPEGTLWVGTGHGLNRYQHGVLESYVDLEPRALDVVAALHADAAGAVWIGTDRGLWRHQAGQFFAFEDAHGGPPAVGQIVEDNRENLWLARGETLMRIAKARLNAVADGQSGHAPSRVFSRSDGLRWKLVSDAGRAAKTQTGLLVFAADEGVVWVDPADLPQVETAPPARIERVILNGEPLGEPGTETGIGPPVPVTLPPGDNRLEIHYAGLSYLAPEQLRFRHRLRGLSDEWEETPGIRLARFRALPPGSYDFEVAAAQATGDWGNPPASLGIRVLSPWWQATWLRTIVGAALLAAAGGWYALRVQRLEQLSAARRGFSMRLLEREESERRRLSRELHDGLGQDLLVLKNQASLLSRQLPPDRPDLEQIARAIAEVSQAAIEGARTIARNLRPADLDRAGLTRSLEAMLDRAAAGSPMVINQTIENLDGSLPPEAEVILYRITQELINNALKHANAPRAFVDLRRTDHLIELVVSDNGCGFDPHLVRGRAGLAEGLGLDSVHERVAMLDGEIRMESAPGQGARFRVRIPVPPATQRPEPGPP